MTGCILLLERHVQHAFQLPSKMEGWQCLPPSLSLPDAQQKVSKSPCMANIVCSPVMQMRVKSTWQQEAQSGISALLLMSAIWSYKTSAHRWSNWLIGCQTPCPWHIHLITAKWHQCRTSIQVIIVVPSCQVAASWRDAGTIANRSCESSLAV